MVWLSYFPAYLLYCIVTRFILDNKCYQSNTASSQNYPSFHVNIAQNVSGDSGFSWRNWSQNVGNHLLAKLKKKIHRRLPRYLTFCPSNPTVRKHTFYTLGGERQQESKNPCPGTKCNNPTKQPKTICLVSSFSLIVWLRAVRLSEVIIRVESFSISSATLLTSCTRNSVLILLEASCSPSVLCDNSESISSMKITAGRWHLATANNARTIFSPSPTYKTNKQ